MQHRRPCPCHSPRRGGVPRRRRLGRAAPPTTGWDALRAASGTLPGGFPPRAGQRAPRRLRAPRSFGKGHPAPFENSPTPPTRLSAAGPRSPRGCQTATLCWAAGPWWPSTSGAGIVAAPSGGTRSATFCRQSPLPPLMVSEEISRILHSACAGPAVKPAAPKTCAGEPCSAQALGRRIDREAASSAHSGRRQAIPTRQPAFHRS
mmetsp:Transcript_76416/g.211077  ORF Transcript_76416/g.211077 Transcript_76416/m.211077 type:complete len:205 (-) Transcript_76416:1290-1904(-)